MERRRQQRFCKNVIVVFIVGFCCYTSYHFVLDKETISTFVVERLPDNLPVVKHQHHTGISEKTKEYRNNELEIKSTSELVSATDGKKQNTIANVYENKQTKASDTYGEKKNTVSVTDESTVSTTNRSKQNTNSDVDDESTVSTTYRSKQNTNSDVDDESTVSTTNRSKQNTNSDVDDESTVSTTNRSKQNTNSDVDDESTVSTTYRSKQNTNSDVDDVGTVSTTYRSKQNTNSVTDESTVSTTYERKQNTNSDVDESKQNTTSGVDERKQNTNSDVDESKQNTTFGVDEGKQNTNSDVDESKQNTTFGVDEGKQNTNFDTNERKQNTTSGVDEGKQNTNSDTNERKQNTTSGVDEGKQNTNSDVDESKQNTTSGVDEGKQNTNSDTNERKQNTTSGVDEGKQNTNFDVDERKQNTNSGVDERKQNKTSDTEKGKQNISTMHGASSSKTDQPKIMKTLYDNDSLPPVETSEVKEELQPSDIDTLLEYKNDSKLTVADDKQPVFVLILTYARSGSSWLGSITSMAENSMYVFEPLHGIIKEGFYMKDKLCHYDNTCRDQQLNETETSEFAMDTLYKLYTCQFTKLHPEALIQFIRFLETKPMKTEFKTCFRQNRFPEICLLQLEANCLNTSHRILKTIRVSMEIAAIMLERIPNLRIIHLVRDPRGITNSRQKARSTFRTSAKTRPHSKSLCNIMNSNMNYSDLIQAKYPGRLKTVFYESLAERPVDGAKFVYDFMKSNLTETISKNIYQSSHADVEDTNYYGTSRSNSSLTAYAWRKTFGIAKTRIVDNACRDVYQKLGYIALDTEVQLKSLKYPSRTLHVDNIDGFI
ncbi:hypothetical protein ACF0H5_017394 [Mactra antiquata]